MDQCCKNQTGYNIVLTVYTGREGEYRNKLDISIIVKYDEVVNHCINKNPYIHNDALQFKYQSNTIL